MLVFTISQTLGEAVTAAEFGILRVGTDYKTMNGVNKTNIDCSFTRGMVENYSTLGKIQPFSLRLNFSSRAIIFHHSPHEQSV